MEISGKGFFFFIVILILAVCSFAEENTITVHKGVLDLRGWSPVCDGNIKMDGDWEFYWSAFYTPDDFKNGALVPDAHVNVPGAWTGTSIRGQALPNTGYATYRLIILADSCSNQMIYFKEIATSYKAWLNGELIAQAGKVARDKGLAIPAYRMNKAVVSLHSGQNELIVRVSNFHHRINSFEYPPLIGESVAVEKTVFYENAVDLIILGLLLVMAFYHLGLFFFRPKNVPMLIFSLFCILALFRVLVTTNCLLENFFPSVKWELVYFLKYFTLYTIIPLLALWIQQTFGVKKHKWVFSSLYIVSGLFLLTLLLPPLVYTQLLVLYEFAAIIYFIVILAGLIKYVSEGATGALIFLISMLILTLATVNDMFYFNDIIKTSEMVPAGIFVLILGQALTLGKRFTAVFEKNEELNKQLQYDIAAKLEANLKLRESEEKFFTIFNSTPNAVAVLSPEFKVFEANSAFRRSFSPDEHQGLDFFAHLVPDSYQQEIRCRTEQLPHGVALHGFECEFLRHDKTLIPVELTISVFSHNQAQYFLAIIRDISERKNFERWMYNIGVQIESRERRQLASDLHDNVGPLLSSMNMYLSALSHKNEPVADAGVILNIQRILKDTITSVREISNNLSPQVLENHGLSVAINAFFCTKRKLIDIKIDNRLGDFRFSETKEIMVYQILKEAFNNSIKHSKGDKVELRLEKKDNFIFIRYSDNGVGFRFDEKLLTGKENLGLLSIINRIKNMNGKYKIETSPGNGFLLKFSFKVTS